VAANDGTDMGLGLRVDRWSLLIVNAVILGCHHFDQIAHVLGIASSVLSRRLSGMVEAGLLLCQPDLNDARRNIYRLTPASRDLFGYLVCFSTWAARDHLHQPSSIRPIHKGCGKPFVPQVSCSACGEPVKPRDVSFDLPAKPTATA
jgi:DNA-binding HxlR family transcriptional regulator